MSDDDWKPALLKGVDLTKLSLNAEEGFVLSRIDGSTSLKSLEHLTGLTRARVSEIVERLVDEGAVEGGGGGAPRSARAQARVPDPTVQDAAPVGGPTDEWTYEYESSEAPDDDELLFSDDDEPPAEPAEERAEDDAPATDDGDVDEGGEEEGEEEEPSVEEGNFRKLYETELKHLERDHRVKLAGEAKGATLSALCFDQDPAVVRGVLENTGVGLEHARLIAAHHRNPIGLDALARRAEFLRDGHVQRMLLRNNQTSEVLLKRLMSNRPLAQLFQLNKSRELTERAKRRARQELRRTFQVTSAEERVSLIFATEGRCLAMLVGLALDAKTTALLCGRTYNSTLLVTNVLRFSATPPPLIAHLAKQQTVRRTPSLMKLVKQHPNCPSQVKKG